MGLGTRRVSASSAGGRGEDEVELELVAPLAHDAPCQLAPARLAELGYSNVRVRCGDGTLGWPEHAPYDGIAVAAVGPRPPPALLDQLTIGGRLVMPIGPDGDQMLMRLTRTGATSYEQEPLVGVRFVPLIGAQGFARSAAAGR